MKTKVTFLAADGSELASFTMENYSPRVVAHVCDTLEYDSAAVYVSPSNRRVVHEFRFKKDADVMEKLSSPPFKSVEF